MAVACELLPGYRQGESWGQQLGSQSTSSASARMVPPADADEFDSARQSICIEAHTTAMVDLAFGGIRPVAPLIVSVDVRGGFCDVVHEEFGVFGRGRTCREAFADFLQSLAADYRAYAEEADENLDPYALELANRYRNFFGKA